MHEPILHYAFLPHILIELKTIIRETWMSIPSKGNSGFTLFFFYKYVLCMGQVKQNPLEYIKFTEAT